METIEEPNIRFITYEDLVEHIVAFDHFDDRKILINSKFIISLESHFWGNADILGESPARTNCLRAGIVTAGWLNPVVNMQEYDKTLC